MEKSFIFKKLDFVLKKKENQLSFKQKIISKKIDKLSALSGKVKLIKANYNIINFFIIIILISNVYEYLLLNDSYITFKIISEYDYIKLFFPFDKNPACKNLTLPDIIEVDGINYTNITFNYTINNITKKEVKLIWNNNKPKSTECLFEYCTYITKIDLSNFDTSEVTSMYRMFSRCQSLTYLNLTNLNTSNVEKMDQLFMACRNLKSLDISSFDTSNTKSMYYMFASCQKLITLNLSNFDTSKVIKMNGMFEGCSSFKNLDISNFNTSNVNTMDLMFHNCYSLVSLNLSNFDTSQVTNISSMFSGCSNITSLNLSNFNTQNVKSMSYLFSNCKSLSNLDISNFNTKNVGKMEYMFNNCSNLTSFNLFHFDTSKVTNMNKMFFNCSSLISLNISNFNALEVTTMNSIFSDCYLMTKLDLTNLNTSKVKDMGGMFSNCYSLNSLDLTGFDTSQVTIMDNMFENCSNLTTLNLPNFNIDKVNSMKGIFYNCLNLIFINLKAAKINSDVDTQDIFAFTNNNLIICSENEEWGKLLSNEYLIMNYLNTTNNETSFKCFQKLINNISNTNINDNKKDDIYQIEIENQSYKNCSNKTIYTYIQIKQLINEINSTKLENGNDEEITEENIIITLTTTSNQKNNENSNKTTINLGECEYRLKWYYNISINDSLYIIKLDIKEEGMKIPKIEYEVYYPFYSSNELTKLNLSICKDTKIEISIPIIINENIEKYNISSNYYNDICSTASSKNGADITLSDRKNEFLNNNMTLCEENCKLIDYNYTNKKAKCSCDIKINLPNIETIKFDKDLLKKSFIDINNMINIKIMKCYKSVFIKNKLKNNLGFLINFCVLVLFFITLIIFICKSWEQLYIIMRQAK